MKTTFKCNRLMLFFAWNKSKETRQERKNKKGKNNENKEETKNNKREREREREKGKWDKLGRNKGRHWRMSRITLFFRGEQTFF